MHEDTGSAAFQPDWDAPFRRRKPLSFAQVDVDEQGCALNIFVSAASRKHRGQQPISIHGSCDGEAFELLGRVTAQRSSVGRDLEQGFERSENTFEQAFTVLWRHYASMNFNGPSARGY